MICVFFCDSWDCQCQCVVTFERKVNPILQMTVSLGAEIWNSGPVSLLQHFGTLKHLDSIHKLALAGDQG